MKDPVAFIVIALVVLGLGLLVDRVIGPWRVKRWHEKFIRDYRAGRIKPVVHSQTLIADNESFAVRDEKTGLVGEKTGWRQIVKATAFKRDLFSTDLICIFFHFAGETGVEVNEETNGWMAFIESLPDHLPGCQPSDRWLYSVMLPAFATNEMVIFTRGSAMPAKGEPA